MAIEDYVSDCFRDAFFLLLVFCFIAGTVSSTINNPVESEFEIAFTAYRLRQFDQSGVPYGSRNSKFSYEAVSLNQSALRRCLVVRWNDLAEQNVAELFSASAGAVLVVVPAGLLPPTSKSKFGTVEEQLAGLSTNLAVYFTPSTDLTENLVDSIRTTRAPTALEQIYNVFAENAFQISTSSSLSSNSLANQQFTNIIGRLDALDKNAPTIVVVAHYDSRSLVPGLSSGYDQNGSGLMALLTIMSKLSELYKKNDMHPKLNVVFALTALGSYNYRGSRKLAEELAERQADGDRILLVVCLESLLGGDDGELYAHVSKQLQEKTAPFNFLRRMNYFMTPEKERKVVIKSNIDAENFVWEHEAYFYNRISALTLSHFPSADHVSRNFLINDVDPKKEAHDLEVFNWRVQVITETVVSYVFGLNMEWCTPEIRQSSSSCHVVQPFIATQMDSSLREMAATPRPAVALPTNLISDLHKMVKNYCHRVEKRTFLSTDLQVYSGHVDKIVAQVVKPALFELVLASAISLYMFLIYHASLNAQTLLHWPVLKVKTN